MTFDPPWDVMILYKYIRVDHSKMTYLPMIYQQYACTCDKPFENINIKKQLIIIKCNILKLNGIFSYIQTGIKHCTGFRITGKSWRNVSSVLHGQ